MRDWSIVYSPSIMNFHSHQMSMPSTQSSLASGFVCHWMFWNPLNSKQEVLKGAGDFLLEQFLRVTLKVELVLRGWWKQLIHSHTIKPLHISIELLDNRDGEQGLNFGSGLRGLSIILLIPTSSPLVMWELPANIYSL